MPRFQALCRIVLEETMNSKRKNDTSISGFPGKLTHNTSSNESSEVRSTYLSQDYRRGHFICLKDMQRDTSSQINQRECHYAAEERMSGLFHSTKRGNTTDSKKKNHHLSHHELEQQLILKHQWLAVVRQKVFHACSFPTRTFMNFSAKPQRFYTKFCVNQDTFPSKIILFWAIIGMRPWIWVKAYMALPSEHVGFDSGSVQATAY